MPRLRGHHLICLHFFHGEGYTPEFVDNLRIVTANVRNEKIEICTGADDICGRCPHLKGSTCGYSERADEEIAEMDRKALDLLGMASGTKAEWGMIKENLANLFHDWFKTYCAVCDWRWACERDGYYRRLVGEGTKDHDN